MCVCVCVRCVCVYARLLIIVVLCGLCRNGSEGTSTAAWQIWRQTFSCCARTRARTTLRVPLSTGTRSNLRGPSIRQRPNLAALQWSSPPATMKTAQSHRRYVRAPCVAGKTFTCPEEGNGGVGCEACIAQRRCNAHGTRMPRTHACTCLACTAMHCGIGELLQIIFAFLADVFFTRTARTYCMMCII